MPNYSGIWTEQAMMQAVAAGTWSSVPGAPTIGTATATGATSASVAFTAPGFAGIPATITSYTVTSSPGNITATGTSSPIAITGLTEGTPYTFRVTATNASGTGTASAASNSVTPVQIDYVEDVFSTWLYTGNGSTQTINNGIDLAGKGGLVWMKNRTTAGDHHVLTDTVTGATKQLASNLTDPQYTYPGFGLTSFNSTGFTVIDNSTGSYYVNGSSKNYVSWTFREQPKFFDVVTYTGNGAAGRTIAHNLGSVPGCIIVKSTSNQVGWAVYHRQLNSGTNPQNFYLTLNATTAQSASSGFWNNTAPTSSDFTVGTSNNVNGNGITYVAYLFAHNAGGFGLTGTDNVISCGSYTGNGSATGPVVTLGYEPQWLLVKQASSTGNWFLTDTMRGFSQTSDQFLLANSSGAEFTRTNYVNPLATGFQIATADFDLNESGGTYIYIAIRRGPMKVPTTGTSVFAPLAVNNATGTVNTTGFPVDLQMQFYRPGGISPGTSQWIDRLRGFSSTSTDSGTRLYTTGTEAEAATAIGTLFNNIGFSTGASWASVSMSYNNFRRAPGFMDVVCYTGTGSARTVAHNLGVAPELMIVKIRNQAGAAWAVYNAASGNTKVIRLNTTAAETTSSAYWNNTSPTSSVFTVGNDGDVNNSGDTYVGYLFATCPGVSKVGSYTGTGSTQVINCGFAAGARFVLIKATSTTGNWLVWDTARGMIPSNDPYLELNTTNAEVTGTDWVDTAATGFELSNNAGNLANSNGVSYIFLAIA